MADGDEEDRGLLDDDDETPEGPAQLFPVGSTWIVDNRGRRKVLRRRL